MKNQLFYGDDLRFLSNKIPEKSKNIFPILESFKQHLLKIYPQEALNLILFGSYARGDFREDSDIDLLILLPFFESTFEEIERLSELRYEFLLNYGLVISVMVAKTTDFDTQQKAIFRNIGKEGILL